MYQYLFVVVSTKVVCFNRLRITRERYPIYLSDSAALRRRHAKAFHNYTHYSLSMQVAHLDTLSTQHFYSIEYPGLVSPDSIPIAIETLGGQSSINNVLGRRKQPTDSRDNLLDLNFRPGNPFAHPVPGEAVGTNKLLMKITKRRVNQKSMGLEDGRPIGEYTSTVLGIVPRTVRYRSKRFTNSPIPV